MSDTDIEFEFEDEQTPKDKLKKLREKLASCDKERREYLEGWQRAKADLINARKELERERQGMFEYAHSSFLEDLLPAIDSFDMAFANKEQWESVSENWRKGIEYIHSQIQTALSNNNIEPINPSIGDSVDTNEHSIVGEEEVDMPPGTIIKVRRRGWKLKDKIIRPAEVIISKDK